MSYFEIVFFFFKDKGVLKYYDLSKFRHLFNAKIFQKSGIYSVNLLIKGYKNSSDGHKII